MSVGLGRCDKARTRPRPRSWPGASLPGSHRGTARSVSRWCAVSLLLILSVGLCFSLSGCIRVYHLGDKTSESYDTVFSRQLGRGRVRAPKAMEGELGEHAAEKMINPPKKTSRSGGLTGLLVRGN